MFLQDHLSDVGSTPKAAAVAAAAAVGSSSSNSASTPGQPDGRHSSGSRGGAAEPAGPQGSSGHAAASHGTAVTFTSSEYDDLVDDIVSDKPQLNLSDLEAKLDIINPEDLTVSVEEGSVCCCSVKAFTDCRAVCRGVVFSPET